MIKGEKMYNDTPYTRKGVPHLPGYSTYRNQTIANKLYELIREIVRNELNDSLDKMRNRES